MEQNVSDIVAQLEQNPYQILPVYAKYSGILHYNNIQEGTTVLPVMGKWKEIPATVLATITREKIDKLICAEKKGVVQKIYPELEGNFVQAGTEIMSLKHYYSKEEVLEIVLQHSLYLFVAPERAKYYFVADIEKKIVSFGCRSIRVHDGMPLFIMSRMKREVTLPYSGPEGVIYSVYSNPTENVDVNAPLIGVCQEEMLPHIEEIVTTLQCQWKEK